MNVFNYLLLYIYIFSIVIHALHKIMMLFYLFFDELILCEYYLF